MLPEGQDNDARALVRARLLSLDLCCDGVHLRPRVPKRSGPRPAGPATCQYPLLRMRASWSSTAFAVQMTRCADRVAGQLRLERVRGNPHDRVGPIVQRDGTSDQVRIGPEMAAPQPCAHHGDAVRALLVLLGTEVAAGERRQTEDVEEPFGHLRGAQHLGALATGVVVAVGLVRRRSRRSSSRARASPGSCPAPRRRVARVRPCRSQTVTMRSGSG